MVRNYEHIVKFEDVHQAVMALKPSKTEIPKKKASKLSDLWRKKVSSLRLYASKLFGGNVDQIINYLRSFSWRTLSEKLADLPMSKKKCDEWPVILNENLQRKVNMMRRLILFASKNQPVQFILQRLMYEYKGSDYGLRVKNISAFFR